MEFIREMKRRYEILLEKIKRGEAREYPISTGFLDENGKLMNAEEVRERIKSRKKERKNE